MKNKKCIDCDIQISKNAIRCIPCHNEYKQSEIMRQRVSNTMKRLYAEGKKIIWNIGLTKETDERVGKISENESKNKKILYSEGKLKVWNIGLTKEIDERLKKSSEKSIETKRKSFADGKIKIWNDGLTKEIDDRIRINTERSGKTLHKLYKEGKLKTNKIRERRAKQILPIKDTSIELKIQGFCRLLKLEYLTHCYINILHGYQCDILIPVQEGITQKTIIETDGDAFHFNPLKYKKEDKLFKNGMTAEERWKLDQIRTQELIEKGFRVIRLWENEIKVMTINNFQNKLNLKENK